MKQQQLSSVELDDLKIHWKQLESKWLQRLEGNSTTRIKNEVHGRHEELIILLRLILHHCIYRIIKILKEEKLLNNNDFIISNHISLTGIQIKGHQGSGRFHICRSLSSSWLDSTSVVIDISDYSNGSRIFSVIPKSDSIASLPSSDSSPNKIFESVFKDLLERLQTDSSLEGKLRAILYSGYLLLDSYKNYIRLFGSVNIEYLASGGGIIFVIFKNLHLLKTQTDQRILNNRAVSSSDYLRDSKSDKTRVISGLIEEFIVRWSTDMLPIIHLTTTTLTVNDDSSIGSNIVAESLPPELVNRIGGFNNSVTLRFPLSFDDRDALLKFFLNASNCVSLDPALHRDVILSISGFQPSDICCLVHQAVYAAILDVSTEAGLLNQDLNSDAPQQTIRLHRKHFMHSLSRTSPSAMRSVSSAFEYIPLKTRRWLANSSPAGNSSTSAFSAPFFWGLSEIVGKSELKNRLDCDVVKPFLNNAVKTKTLPPGIILSGRTGSGKTHIARCIANACEADLLVVQSADIMKPKLGDSEKSVNMLFELALKSSPCVVVIENIEILCPAFMGSSENPEEHTDVERNQGETETGTPQFHSGEAPSAGTVRVSFEILRGLDNIRFMNLPERIADSQIRNNLNDSHRVLIIMTTQQPHKIDFRLLEPHRSIEYFDIESEDTNSKDLCDLFERYLPFTSFQFCSRFDNVDLRSFLMHLLPDSPASIVRLTEAIGLSGVRRRINRDHLKIDSESLDCNSTTLCWCDVVSALSIEQIQWD